MNDVFIDISGGEIYFEPEFSVRNGASFSPDDYPRLVAGWLNRNGFSPTTRVSCSSSCDFPEEYGITDPNFSFNKWFKSVVIARYEIVDESKI